MLIVWYLLIRTERRKCSCIFSFYYFTARAQTDETETFRDKIRARDKAEMVWTSAEKVWWIFWQKKIMTRELQDRIKNTERIYGCSEGGLM